MSTAPHRLPSAIFCIAAGVFAALLSAAVAAQEENSRLHLIPLVREALEQTGTPLLPAEVSATLAATLPDTEGVTPPPLPLQYDTSPSTRWMLAEQVRNSGAQRRQALIWRIWRRLLLANLQTEASPAILHPWLELLELLKNPLQTEAGRQKALAAWQQEYGAHPAGLIAAHMDQLLRTRHTDEKKRFAVLLPQSGELTAAGNLIATGIRIAWYHLRAQQQAAHSTTPMPELLFMDSTTPVDQLVSAILSEEIELIIGPLDKTRAQHFVEALQNHVNYPRTLLLNRLNRELSDDNFWQFGLPVEQEVASLVHFAKSHGLQRAGALMLDTPAGLRAGTALEDLWLELGGEWIGTEVVSAQGEMTEAGKDLLLLESSSRRAQLLQRIINRRMHSTPRPRQDLDVLFIAAPGTRGLEVTAALTYNYLKEVPLYSLASIYQPQRLVNEFDLEGVRFMDMPWMVRPASQLGYGEEFSDAQYRHRLLALGIDALAVARRIESNTLDDRLPHWGVTGLLTANSRQQIEWQPVPVIIKKGLPELLAP